MWFLLGLCYCCCSILLLFCATVDGLEFNPSSLDGSGVTGRAEIPSSFTFLYWVRDESSASAPDPPKHFCLGGDDDVNDACSPCGIDETCGTRFAVVHGADSQIHLDVGNGSRASRRMESTGIGIVSGRWKHYSFVLGGGTSQVYVNALGPAAELVGLPTSFAFSKVSGVILDRVSFRGRSVHPHLPSSHSRQSLIPWPLRTHPPSFLPSLHLPSFLPSFLPGDPCAPV